MIPFGMQACDVGAGLAPDSGAARAESERRSLRHALLRVLTSGFLLAAFAPWLISDPTDDPLRDLLRLGHSTLFFTAAIWTLVAARDCGSRRDRSDGFQPV